MRLSGPMKKCLIAIADRAAYIPRWHGDAAPTIVALERRGLIAKLGKRAWLSKSGEWEPTGAGWRAAYLLRFTADQCTHGP